jgi:hypothetical protein
MPLKTCFEDLLMVSFTDVGGQGDRYKFTLPTVAGETLLGAMRHLKGCYGWNDAADILG